MRYLVDVNVLCEPTKQQPNPKVCDWIDAHECELVVDPIVMGEIWCGITALPIGRRRQGLVTWFHTLRGKLHCLSWSIDTSLVWAEICNDVRQAGFTIGIADTMIAATAKLHGLTVATRNVKDFSRCGVPVFDPFV